MSNIMIYEGCDIVGKTYLAKSLAKKTNSIYYRIDLHEYDNSGIAGCHGVKWAVYKSLFDFIESIHGELNNDIIIDRAFMSYLVYTKFYVPEMANGLDPVIKLVKSNKEFMSASHVYVRHKDPESAKVIYYRALLDRTLLDENDKFNSFDDYWNHYKMIDSLYMEFYKLLGIEPIIIDHVYTAEE